MPAKPIAIGELFFTKKGDASDFLKTTLNKYRPGQTVSEIDASMLASLINMHRDAATKIGEGIDYFSVNSADFGTQCFWIHRIDGSSERFSYKKCLI